MKHAIYPFLLFILILTGCQSVLFTGMMLFKGNDQKPRHDILLTGEKRVAVVPRAMYSNAYEMQNAPLMIARQVNHLLDENVRENIRPHQRNKKLHLVEQSKVEMWLDNCNNDFDSFAEVGRDKSIKADIVIGFDIINFQIRDPQNPYLIQGRCQVQVQAIDCVTGNIEATENLMIVYPNMPMSGTGGSSDESLFRPQFMQVVAERIAAQFHYYDPIKLQRMDNDSHLN